MLLKNGCSQLLINIRTVERLSRGLVSHTCTHCRPNFIHANVLHWKGQSLERSRCNDQQISRFTSDESKTAKEQLRTTGFYSEDKKTDDLSVILATKFITGRHRKGNVREVLFLYRFWFGYSHI